MQIINFFKVEKKDSWAPKPASLQYDLSHNPVSMWGYLCLCYSQFLPSPILKITELPNSMFTIYFRKHENNINLRCERDRGPCGRETILLWGRKSSIHSRWEPMGAPGLNSFKLFVFIYLQVRSLMSRECRCLPQSFKVSQCQNPNEDHKSYYRDSINKAGDLT